MLSANDMESYLESSDSVEWENAIESEIYSLATMSTWSLSYWLDDRRAMKYKWMFMIKTNSDGSVERFKVRLVVNGFSEVPGVDYSTLMHGYPKMFLVLYPLVWLLSFKWIFIILISQQCSSTLNFMTMKSYSWRFPKEKPGMVALLRY
jgi:hypothetical protein